VERAALDIATRELVEVADPSDADRAATLAAVTHSVLRNVADGDGATRRYLDAASKLRLQGHLSMWSPSREVSELIALTALDRSVPSDNSVVTSYGGYLSQGSD